MRTEALDWYLGESPWGGPIASPAMAVRLLRNGEQGIDFRRARAVGLFGAIEIRHIAGPVMLDRDYLCSAEILAIGSTPKTEYVWYESTLEEKTGQPVAAMIMMLRLMKASSELWTAETS